MRYTRIPVVLLAVLAIYASYRSDIQAIEERVLAIFLTLSPAAQTPQDIVIVGVDEAATERFGVWPWSGYKLAELISQLKHVKAKTIGLMLPGLSDQASNTDALQRIVRLSIPSIQDQTLSQLTTQLDEHQVVHEVLSGAENIVVEMPYGETNLAPSSAEKLSIDKNLVAIDSFATMQKPVSTITRWAYGAPRQKLHLLPLLATFTDPTVVKGLGLYRREGEISVYEPLAVEYKGQYYPSFTLALLSNALSVSADKPSVDIGKGVQIGNTFINTAANQRVYPHQAAQGMVAKQFSVTEFLDGSIDARQLRNKIILVGLTDSRYLTGSHHDGQRNIAPAEWVARLLQGVLHHQLLTVPHWAFGYQRSMLVVVALYLLFLPRRLRGGLGLLLGCSLSLVLINSELVLLLANNFWLPGTLPAIVLLLGQLMLYAMNRIQNAFRHRESELAAAYHELALNLQIQGKFAQAAEYLRRCPLDPRTMENLYNIAMEFERRRQFNQAISVYDHIAQKNPKYRDIQQRRQRNESVADRDFMSTSNGLNMAATLVVNSPGIAQPILGRYELEEVLGQGAMGTVYKGRDPKIGRTVAIKTLPLSQEFESRELEEVRKRFLREAETAGRLSHPYIVTIFDVGEEHDLAYIAMDFIEGAGLDHYARPDSLLPVREVFDIGIAVAEALAYAHEQNVVHRDVKPANIIYDTETKKLKVTDFGIACLTDNSRTRTGTVLGSPSYMSPEQLEGGKLDGRADLFSLGVTLYQLFTGCLPFVGESMTALAYKIANSKVQSPRKIRSDLPACVTRILNRCLEKNPRQRYQHGEELAEALRRCRP